MGKKTRRRSTLPTSSSRGFSLLEILVVVGIGLVVAAIGIPTMARMASNARLHAGLTSMSGLLQNCRMLAVKQNRTLSALFVVEDETALVAYVKKATESSSPRVPADPQVKWEAPVEMSIDDPSGPNAPTPLTSTDLGFTPVDGLPSFNARGLPCVFDTDTAACDNHGFLYYFKDTSVVDGKGWAALSVTPAGRIKKWYWNGQNWTD